ncbi:MAG: hypothetical protein QXE05_10665, partial [Nitrososphaeria archaeon]
MRIRIKLYTIYSLAFYVITLLAFLFFSYFFKELKILYFATPFALIAFIFLYVLLCSKDKEFSFRIAHVQIHNVFLYALTMLFVFAVLFVPAYSGSMLEYMKIPPLNWLRYLSSLLLTSFLPGYFLLKTLDRNNVLDTGIIIILSYLVSLFITFLAGFFILLSANSLGSLGLPIIVTTNIILIVIYYLTNRKRTRIHPLRVNWIELKLILFILTVITVGSVITMIGNLPLTSGDMQRFHGIALDISEGFPVYGGKMIIYPGGYLFAIYLYVLFILSGIPLALAEQGLYILNFMPILAFYSSIKAWFSEDQDNRLLLVAITLSILLGFGGLYALYLKFTHPAYDIIHLLYTTTFKTYDIYMRIIYIPDIVAPICNIGLPVFFTLLYFLNKNSSNLIRATIIPALVALGYMGHMPEVIIFIIIAFIYALFLRKSNSVKIGPYIVLGLGVVVLVDLVAQVQIYVSSAGEGLSLHFIISLILAVVISVAELVKDRYAFLFSMNLRTSLLEKLGKSWQYGRWALIYIYVFFFVIWLTIEKDFNLWTWGGYSFTPFFVFPLRFGAVGLLAIISIFIYFSKIVRDRRLFFFLLLIPIGFALEQWANYYPFYPAYRWGTIAFVGACIMAAHGVINIIDKVRRSPKRTIIVCVLLGFLMISGMLSTALFYVNASYYSIFNGISQDELDALDYIRQNILSNVSVLTFTTHSANRLRNFAGINAVQDAQRWSKLLLSTSNPYIIIYVFSLSNIKYIYVAREDVELLKFSTLNSIIKYFPQVLKNGYATIYEVPALTAPSSQASFGVLDFSPSFRKLENTTWVDYSFTKGWCPYRQYGNVKNYTSEVRNGIMKISVTSNQSGNIWVSYSLPLALKTKDSVLSFRYKVDNDYTWFTIQLRNASNEVFFYKAHMTDKTFTTRSYNLPDDQVISRIELIV